MKYPSVISFILYTYDDYLKNLYSNFDDISYNSL